MAILPEPFTLAPLEASTDENSADELHSNGEEKYTKAIEFDDNEDEDESLHFPMCPKLPGSQYVLPSISSIVFAFSKKSERRLL